MLRGHAGQQVEERVELRFAVQPQLGLSCLTGQPDGTYGPTGVVRRAGGDDRQHRRRRLKRDDPATVAEPAQPLGELSPVTAGVNDDVDATGPDHLGQRPVGHTRLGSARPADHVETSAAQQPAGIFYQTHRFWTLTRTAELQHANHNANS